MAANIRVGFTIHPRWIYQGDLKAFTNPLRKAGLEVFEFELDDRVDLWKDFQPLMDEVIQQGFDLSFHAPYRLPHSLVGFAGKSRQAIIKDYKPLLDIAHQYAHKMGSAKTVVLHGARAMYGDHDSLKADTLSFIKWLLQEYPDLNFALENNNPTEPDIERVGETRTEVLEILTEIDSPRLGICWDMGHDYLAHRKETLTKEWLKDVRHVHLHDVDENEIDHYPLIYDRVPHSTWLAALKKAGMQGTVILELKGWLLRDYTFAKIMEMLVKSITMIKAEVT